MQRIAIFPGTFDPITLGHMDLIARALVLFDKVIIGVAKSTKKQTLFSLTERVELVKQAAQESKLAASRLEVIGFTGLLVNLAREYNAAVLIRGLRVISDFEYEMQLANMNRSLDSSIETIFVSPSEQYSFISSSLIKEIASMQGEITKFVPEVVAKALHNKLVR